MKPLKELVLNKRQIQREMRKLRMPLDMAQSHRVIFAVEGDMLKVVDFR